jgi:DNA-binding response OmpR family regulator
MENPPVEAPARPRESVLLVEDDAAVLRVEARILAARGYAVISAANAAAALSAVEGRGAPVDLLVAAVGLRGTSGRALARELSRRNLARRTLYVSGGPGDLLARSRVLPPGLAYLNKPFSLAEFMGKIRSVIDGPVEKALA